MVNNKNEFNLLEVIKASQKQDDKTLDKKDLKYVIYARKSTDEKGKQAHSISDQIIECKAIAKTRKLNVIDIVKEKQSAKDSDIRPKFRAMLNNINNGEYNAILAWHPDRLARNMKEGGEIIDLIDNNILCDLQFPSFYFENTPTGKMLLGFAFVISKQYTDQLSDNVKRGNRNLVKKGKFIGKHKYGYYKDVNCFLRPDGNNFNIIQEAWKLRLENETLDEIADYINKQGFTVTKGIGNTKRTIYKMNDAKLSNMFKDPVYTGILLYGENEPIILNDYYNFTPIVSEDKYCKIMGYDKRKHKLIEKIRGTKREETKADLLRGMVFCDECGKRMSSGLTVKKDKKTKKIKQKYYNYRCENKKCKYHASGRAKIILDFVVDYLTRCSINTKKAYNIYSKNLDKMIKQNRNILKNQLLNNQKKVKELEDKIKQTKGFLLNENDQSLKDDFINDIKEYKRLLSKTNKETTELVSQIDNINKIKMDYSQFLELLSSIPDKLKNNRDMEYLDAIIRNIFSNFYISTKNGGGLKVKIASFELKKPFDNILKSNKNSKWLRRSDSNRQPTG